MKKFYSCFTLSGNNVSPGIKMSGNELVVASDSQGGSVLATSTCEVPSLEVAAVGNHPNGTLIVDPGVGKEKVDKDRVLVLVHEYSPGVGHKRWPSFYIEWNNVGDVEVLVEASRTKGSGSDYYKLAIVPSGWSENIAGQFQNEKDIGGQTISYKPDLV